MPRGFSEFSAQAFVNTHVSHALRPQKPRVEGLAGFLKDGQRFPHQLPLGLSKEQDGHVRLIEELPEGTLNLFQCSAAAEA